MTLSYPDYWPLTNYSPPVEDVRMAYAEGKIGDERFDHDVVWAMDYPEPPAPVLIDGDECLILDVSIPDTIPEPLADLCNKESTSVSVSMDQAEYDFVRERLPPIERRCTFIVACHPDEMELVFDALTD